jgi:hypothetical protein
MYPTQITTLLQPSLLIHAYYKQNTPLFLAYVGLYTTSILYHFTKFNKPPNLKLIKLLCEIDMAFCAYLYGSALYDFFTRNTIKYPYSAICVAFHVFLPLFFMVPFRYKILMWHPDTQVSETWHSIFHLLVYADNHLYLYYS